MLLSIEEKLMETIFTSGQNREIWVSPECWGKDKQSLYIKGATRIIASQHVGKGDYIPESLFYLLGMKANNETALKYQRYDK